MNPHVKRSLTSLPRTRTFSFDEINGYTQWLSLANTSYSGLL